MPKTFFIFNNIKCNPFIYEPPIMGFKVIDWNTYTFGNLWHLNFIDEVGFSFGGERKVYGQLWYAEDSSKIEILENYFGEKNGIAEIINIEVYIELEKNLPIEATTFALKQIKPEYELLNDSRWRF